MNITPVIDAMNDALTDAARRIKERDEEIADLRSRLAAVAKLDESIPPLSWEDVEVIRAALLRGRKDEGYSAYDKEREVIDAALALLPRREEAQGES